MADELIQIVSRCLYTGQLDAWLSMKTVIDFFFHSKNAWSKWTVVVNSCVSVISIWKSNESWEKIELAIKTNESRVELNREIFLQMLFNRYGVYTSLGLQSYTHRIDSIEFVRIINWIQFILLGYLYQSRICCILVDISLPNSSDMNNINEMSIIIIAWRYRKASVQETVMDSKQGAKAMWRAE